MSICVRCFFVYARRRCCWNYACCFRTHYVAYDDDIEPQLTQWTARRRWCWCGESYAAVVYVAILLKSRRRFAVCISIDVYSTPWRRRLMDGWILGTFQLAQVYHLRCLSSLTHTRVQATKSLISMGLNKTDFWRRYERSMIDYGPNWLRWCPCGSDNRTIGRTVCIE